MCLCTEQRHVALGFVRRQAQSAVLRGRGRAVLEVKEKNVFSSSRSHVEE